jgi:thiamine-monophosphate kinase
MKSETAGKKSDLSSGRTGEFALIRRLLRGKSDADDEWLTGPGVVIAAGDDASGLRIQAQNDDLLLQTTDLLVEEVHFKKGWGTAYQLGWKSLAVNLSDIAAMGGKPLHAHLNLAIPSRWTEAEIMELRRGFRDLAARYGIVLLGGDLSASADSLLISVMVNGTVPARQALRRSGAQEGDVIWISGHPGDAAGGLSLLKANASEPPELLQAFLQPGPEVELGLFCSQSGLVRAMIDLSDGLAGDLGHILELSGVGAVIEEEKLPISAALRSAARQWKWDLLETALRGGEDYRLLGCTPERVFASFKTAVQMRLRSSIYAIGKIRREAGLMLKRADGKFIEIPPRSYDHFA